jgi:tripartite-type tricarboxylate transporter receptor subunit TctC
MQKISRRTMLVGAGSAAIVTSGGLIGAAAQTFPSQNFNVICALPPGSGADVVVRYFAEELRKKTGRTTIVENRVGAAGNIAAQYTARAKPDGYTMFIHSGSSIAANYHLFKQPPINPAKDLQVVATLNQQPFMVVVSANSPYKTLKDLTAAMLQKGDKASYAQTNTTGKVMGELYKMATGIKALEIPYRSTADSLNDFASGVVDYGMMDPQSSMTNAMAGRWRMLAVSTDKRMEAVPDLPTMTEEGARGIDLFGWYAVMVPAATPRPVVDALNTWFREIVAQPEARKFLNTQGSTPWITTPEQGQAQLTKDQLAWEGYVKAAKIEPQ